MTIPITIRRDLTGGFEPAQTFLGATQQLFSPTWPAATILNAELLFGATAATGGRVKFLNNCVNCVKLCANFTQSV